MLHFLRNIRQKLIIQENVRKYLLYAVGEIALVMIGILLALQVNNWNEVRKENEREKVYLNLLLQDLETDLKFYNLNIEFYKTVQKSGTNLLSFYNGEKSTDQTNWDLLVDAFHASQIWPIINESATYEELKSAGELSLLENTELRNHLGFYYGGGKSRYESTIGINPPYRKLVRMMIPYDILEYMWDECHETVGDIQLLHECETMVSESEAGEILNKLLSDDELLGELGFFMSSIKGGFEPLNEQYKLSELIVSEINASLQGLK